MAAAIDGSPVGAFVAPLARLTWSHSSRADSARDLTTVATNASKLLRAGVENVVVTLGPEGAVLFQLRAGGRLYAHHFKPDPSLSVIQVTGAGA